MKDFNAILHAYFREGTDAFLPHVSIDCVVLGYEHPNLKILVRRLPGYDFWFLPGGFVRKDESIDDAAYRNLGFWGIENVFLRQVSAFGDVSRGQEALRKQTPDIPWENKIITWASQRFVTVVYYGIVNFDDHKQVKKGIASESKWIDVKKIDQMIFDHLAIVNETRKQLRTELLNHPIAAGFMPETFTLNELRGLFEHILDRGIDRGTFRRKMLKLGLIEEVDKRKDPVGRPSNLYRFNPETYNRFLAGETKFGF